MNKPGKSWPRWPLPITAAVIVFILALMTDLNAGEWLAVFGAAFAVAFWLRSDLVREISVGSDGISVRLAEVEAKTDQARTLAALSVELAAEITKIPFNSLDSGLNSQHDQVYALAYNRLVELGFDDEAIDQTFSNIMESIGDRLIRDGLLTAGGGHRTIAEGQAYRTLQRHVGLPTPKDVENAYLAERLSEEFVSKAFADYRTWYDSSTRMKTFLRIVQGVGPAST